MRQHPLNKLRYGHDPKAPGGGLNVRTTGREDAVDELVASIEAHKLIIPLVGVPQKGLVYVVDGNRRLAALERLVAAGKIKPDEAIPIIECGANGAREIGLAANVMHAPLHEADQYVAFTGLVDAGMSPADVAARFGIAQVRVRRMLALGHLSPTIITAWREGIFGDQAAACVRAFTLAPSVEEQDRVYAELLSRAHDWWHPRWIMDAFGGGKGDGARLVNFVGQDAYESAGGVMTVDLFGENHVIQDPALAKRLADEKLRGECARLLEEGWSWAATRDDLPSGAEWSWSKVTSGGAATDEETRRIDELTALLDADQESEEPIDGVVEAEAEIARIRAEIEARGYGEDDKARSGCIVTIGRNGALEIKSGVLKPGAVKVERRIAGADAPAPKKTATVSAALMHRLSTQMTIATQRAIVGSPHAALAALVAGATTGGYGPVRITLQGYHDPESGSGRTEERFQDAFARYNAMGLYDLLEVTARVVARTIDLQTHNQDNPPSADPATAALAAAMKPGEMDFALREAFDPEDYFAGIAKPLVLRAIGEALNPDEARKVATKPKGEIVAFAVANVPVTGWLPPEIRPASYRGPGAAAPAEFQVAAE